MHIQKRIFVDKVFQQNLSLKKSEQWLRRGFGWGYPSGKGWKNVPKNITQNCQGDHFRGLEFSSCFLETIEKNNHTNKAVLNVQKEVFFEEVLTRRSGFAFEFSKSRSRKLQVCPKVAWDPLFSVHVATPYLQNQALSQEHQRWREIFVVHDSHLQMILVNPLAIQNYNGEACWVSGHLFHSK